MYVYSAHCLLYKSVSLNCLCVNCFCTVWSTLSRISLTKAHVLWWCDNKSDLIWFDLISAWWAAFGLVTGRMRPVGHVLRTAVLESGGRVEKLIAQVAWSPVLSFHSLWWFGVQCHLLVLVHCVFLKTNVTAPVYQDNLEHFMLPSADQLFKDADFIFQQDLAPAHTAKSWLNDHGVGVLN